MIIHVLKSALAFLLLCSSLFFSACGPKVKVTPEFSSKPGLYFALMPIVAPEAMRKERARYLERLLEGELRDRGLFLLDAELVKRACPKAPCTNREFLFSRYPLDGTIEFSVTSSSNSNFGIGFYTEVTGAFRIADKNNKELFLLEHTESKRGGLVFETGQIIQGLKEQYENFGDDGFNALAQKFVRTTVSSLPKTAQQLASQEGTRASSGPTIINAHSEYLQPSVYKICLQGPTEQLAFLVYNRKRSNLREISPGNYCGNFFLEGQQSINAELRTVFGAPSTRIIELGAPPEEPRKQASKKPSVPLAARSKL